ncbi:MAG TPA: hypothetical protein VFU47_03740 [Armatimonadota bacterium]|nr:hypothetical protein [Armatimonadota bacterium]HEU4752198.1 hypothetical protein [Armatimonadota bacterium]
MNPVLWKTLEYAAYGALAALIGSMAKSRGLQLPRIFVQRHADGETVKVIDLGFLTSPILGAFLAAYFDTRPENAIAWGLAAGFVGPSIINAVWDPIVRRVLGAIIPPGETPPPKPDPQLPQEFKL